MSRPTPAFQPTPLDLPPELSLYRERTLGLLHRYQRLSVEAGRLPALLGRELFRARISHYDQFTMEDAVVFVHDVERCLQRLDRISRLLLERIVFQDYSRDEVADRLRCHRKTVYARFDDAVDLLTQQFLDRRLLRGRRPDPKAKRPKRRRSDSPLATLAKAPTAPPPESCQAPKTVENSESHTLETKYIPPVNGTLPPSDVLCW